MIDLLMLLCGLSVESARTLYAKRVAALASGVPNARFSKSLPVQYWEDDEPPEKPEEVELFDRSGNIAIVELRGVMYKFGSAWWGEASTYWATQAVIQATNSPTVDGIVILCDSPGGSTSYLRELADAIAAASAKKPTATQVEGMCASAAYYAACASSGIYMGPMDMVGSIGTIISFYDYSKLAEEEGIKPDPITHDGKGTESLKATGMIGTSLTEDQRALLQGIVDTYFADFRQQVIKGRTGKMTPAQVDKVATGAVFVGQEAVKLGLVDGVRTLDKTIAAVADHANALKAAKYRAA